MNTRFNIILVTIILALALVIITGSNKLNKQLVEKEITRQELSSKNYIKEETSIIEKEATTEAMTEVQTVEYFNNAYQKVDEYINSDNFDSVKDKLNDIFTSTVDFVFYNKEINGITFNDLTEETKIQVLKILEKIDNAIETRKPGYKVIVKDKSSDLYKNVSEKISAGLSNTDSFLEEKIGEERYKNIKDATSDFGNDVKEITIEALDGAKELTKKGISSIKEWYENKRDN